VTAIGKNLLKTLTSIPQCQVMLILPWTTPATPTTATMMMMTRLRDANGLEDDKSINLELD
jgi:hypothetical protein